MLTETPQREEPEMLLPVIEASRVQAASSLLEMLLADQQQLTAVEEFSQRHDRMASADASPTQARYYRRLLPWLRRALGSSMPLMWIWIAVPAARRASWRVIR
ncbi:MAG: hypothetical protein R3C49_27315 [Planctomycetaceae bacterium]